MSRSNGVNNGTGKGTKQPLNSAHERSSASIRIVCTCIHLITCAAPRRLRLTSGDIELRQHSFFFPWRDRFLVNGEP